MNVRATAHTRHGPARAAQCSQHAATRSDHTGTTALRAHDHLYDGGAAECSGSHVSHRREKRDMRPHVPRRRHLRRAAHDHMQMHDRCIDSTSPRAERGPRRARAERRGRDPATGEASTRRLGGDCQTRTPRGCHVIATRLRLGGDCQTRTPCGPSRHASDSRSMPSANCPRGAKERGRPQQMLSGTACKS